MTPSDVIPGLIGLSCLIAFMGSVALLVWMDHRHKQRMKQLAVEEHLALLDRGHGDHARQVAALEARKERYKAIGAIGVASGLGTAGGAAIASMFLFAVKDAGLLMPTLIVLWGIVGAVVIVTVVCSLRALRRAGESNELFPGPDSGLVFRTPADRQAGSTAFRETER